MTHRFRWSAVDVTSLLPRDWRDEIRTVAADADFRDFPRTPILSREAENVLHINRGRVRAEVVLSRLPWLYQLYRAISATSPSRPGGTTEAAADNRYASS